MIRFVFTVPIGAEVLTADHEWLGTVCDARVGYFRIVRDRSEPGHWLPTYTVEATTPESVHLTLAAGDVTRYQHTQPMPRAA
jgi:hypothetical protein